ncbi:MAG: small multi-drug export protein [bacterium]|nr:small multi-drug export protein [bacterium]
MTTELIIFFSAMIPFLELKIAIPLGAKFGLSTTSTFLFAVAGSIVPAALMLALIGPISNYLRKKSIKIDSFFEKLFHRTRKEHSKKFQRYGAIFLITVVAIPLPGSGSGAGALIAFLFGVDYWKALSLIATGTAIGAMLLIAGFESVFAILDLFT